MSEEPKRQDNDAQGFEGNYFWDKPKRYFLDNPTLALTLLYVYFTAIGMLYSAVLYGRFGVNIFDYSEIADFLLAAFKNPLPSFFLVGVQVALSLVAITFIWRRTERSLRHEADEESTSGRIRTEEELEEEGKVRIRLERSMTVASRVRSRTVASLVGALISAVLFSVIFTIQGAAWKAQSIKDGEKPMADVRYSSFSGSAGQVTEPNLTLIGATQKAVFFYDVDEKRTIVIPQAQIVSIEVPE